jgi:hypothetical protein
VVQLAELLYSLVDSSIGDQLTEGIWHLALGDPRPVVGSRKSIEKRVQTNFFEGSEDRVATRTYAGDDDLVGTLASALDQVD